MNRQQLEHFKKDLYTAKPERVKWLLRPKGKNVQDAFMIMTFAQYFKLISFDYKSPSYHFEIYKCLADLASGKLEILDLVGARDTAKTTAVKIWVAYCTCYQLYDVGAVSSKNLKNAQNFLTSVYNMIVSEAVITVFGDPFGRNTYEKAKRQESMTKFDTRAGCTLLAVSSLQSLRGTLAGNDNRRIDLLIFDDYEDSSTIESDTTTKKIWEIMIETIGAMDLSRKKLIRIANYLTESANVHKIVEMKRNPDKEELMIIPIADENGDPYWSDKFVKTDIEAVEENRTRTPDNQVTSLESIERGNPNYEMEYLCNPRKFGDMEFKSDWRDKITLDLDPIDEDEYGLVIYEKPVEGAYYSIGADVSEGKGLDSSTAVVWRIDEKPYTVVATFMDDNIDPDTLGDRMVEWGEWYNYAVLAPEINNNGWATISAIKAKYDISEIYKMEKEDSDEDEDRLHSLGFRTTGGRGGSKAKAIYDFKRAVKQGDVKIPSEALLDEIFGYTKKDRSSTKALPTRHFDLFMACIIGYQCVGWDSDVDIHFA